MRKRPCLLFACIFLTGIAFQRYKWNIVGLIPLCFLLVECFFGISSKHFKRMAGRSILILSAFVLGVIHTEKQEAFRNAYMSRLENDSNAVIYGEILKIEETEYGCRLILTDCYISQTGAEIPCNKIMVYASSDQFRIGQIYQFQGNVQLFEKARNEGNFDSEVFYQSQKIDFSIYEEKSVLLGVKENRIRDNLLEIKEKINQIFLENMKEDAAGFYMGMITGDKSLLSEDTKDLFAIGGISHILAISGLHMSIIGRGVYRLLRKSGLGFLPAGITGSVVLLSYAYMSGNGISALRAVGMMLLYFLAQYKGRSYDMLNALGTVVIYLLLDNPFLIEYSGFQFSITALAGVGFVGKTLGNKIWMSIGITITSLPITALCYYEIPLYSPLVNMIALPLLTPIFVLAIFAACIGAFLPFLARFMLYPCGWLFYFYEFLCRFVKNMPFAGIITGKLEMKKIVIYYLVILAGCILIQYREEKKKTILREKLCLCFFCFLFLLWPKIPQSEIVFLDVGQGDGVYMSAKDGTTIFLDGGSSDVKQVGTYRILPFLKAHGVKEIEYWFISHGDSDHMSGLIEILQEGYRIKNLVISDKMPKDEALEQLLSAAVQSHSNVIYMAAGDCILGKNICIQSLYPWSEGADRNEQSMVLLISFLDAEGKAAVRSLFSGDISSKAEHMLAAEGVLEAVHIYKAAHHGSGYSNSLEFLEKIQPEYTIVSCGKNNRYGHPHPEAIAHMQEVGSEVLFTMESGQITIKIEETTAILRYR